MPSFDLGGSIPPDTAHAVSVSLPEWRHNVGYEEGEAWVVDRMTTGYPRFFVHRSIEALAQAIIAKYGQDGQRALLFPTPKVARSCLDFMRPLLSPDVAQKLYAIDLALDSTKHGSPRLVSLAPTVSAVVFPAAAFPVAKQYWQHTGDGISSRRAEFCQSLLSENLLVPRTGSQTSAKTPPAKVLRGPKRYQRQGSIDGIPSIPTKPPSPPAEVVLEAQESTRFLEERFGRNLDVSLVEAAKSAIRRRIAGSLTHEIDLENSHALPNMSANTRGIVSLKEDDVYLFPAGMNAIFNIHKALLKAREPLKSINFGFPYVDTLKILQKFGPGCEFFGNGSEEDLDDLEKRLQNGERYLALFCEFPGNPLLSCPNLQRIRSLADQYDFAVVVDETIGTFANINVLHVADAVVSSLTKIFSGDCNVMGGGLVLNPQSKYYDGLQRAMEEVFEDTYWPEDVVFMERNSRDFMTRIDRINVNSEAICDILLTSEVVKNIYYPKYNPSRPHYDACRLPNGGYGGLLSVVFKEKRQAMAFYDALEIAKGPSLGTNFTLCSPYVLLAHYQELDWAAEYGVDPDLVRISVGLEETEVLRGVVVKALEAAAAATAT